MTSGDADKCDSTKCSRSRMTSQADLAELISLRNPVPSHKAKSVTPSSQWSVSSKT